MSANKHVFILDDDSDLTYLMDHLFRDEGTDCVIAHSLGELKHLKKDVLACDLAILDINLGCGEPSGLEAYQFLVAQKYAGKVIFFTGHASSHPLVIKAASLPGVRVVEKPTEVHEFLQMLREGF